MRGEAEREREREKKRKKDIYIYMYYYYYYYLLLYLLCAAALEVERPPPSNSALLILCRLMQGVAGGLLAPMMQMMMARHAGRHMARVPLAWLQCLSWSVRMFGPSLGGVILGNPGWRWIFFVNVPVGLLAIGFCMVRLAARRSHQCAPAGFKSASQ